ncbi:MAG: hypothetical protein WDA11_02925 [Thiohalomonadaceae bacterium]
MLHTVFRRLLERYGPQHWWPGETPFEVMVGAVLTQNTAWTNVERAIQNLKANDALAPAAIMAARHEDLAAWLRPSGYFNVKAARVRNFCAWYLQRGGLAALAGEPTTALRNELLAVKGIGPETADDILLYAFERPVFVIDAYTRRLFSRLGQVSGDEPYEALRARFERELRGTDAERVTLYNEYHALIVRHAKESCRRRPLCQACPLADSCSAADSWHQDNHAGHGAANL